MVDDAEESGQRLAAAGRRGEQRRLAREDLRDAKRLRLGERAVRSPEPPRDGRVQAFDEGWRIGFDARRVADRAASANRGAGLDLQAGVKPLLEFRQRHLSNFVSNELKADDVIGQTHDRGRRWIGRD